jgi:hypothetical protein
MSMKGLQTGLKIALILSFLANNTYAAGTMLKLDTIKLSEEFAKNEAQKDFSKKRIIRLNALKTQNKRIKQKNMSKKFGPLLVNFAVRSARRSAIGVNLDLLETLDIIAQRDPGLFFKTDNEHFILSPDSKDDIRRTVDMIKAKFNNHFSRQTIIDKKVSAQLI